MAYENKSKSRLLRFKNIHQGEKIVIVANGPSLNKTDFSLVRNHICIGLNKIFLGFKTFHFYPRYYVAVNAKVIAQSKESIHAMNCVKFLGDRGNENIFEENALTYLVNTSNPPTRFSSNLAEGIHEGDTVTYAALQVAYFMGVKEVILIGLDHQYEFTGKPHEEKTMTGADVNHFSPDYFGYGQTWDNPSLEGSEHSFRIAKEMFESDGRRIVDCTIGGNCSVFEKAPLSDALNGSY